MKNEAAAEPLTAIHAQVIAAREGRDPRVIARLFSGWAVFGERQFVRGYSVLLPDPVVPNLNALGAQERMAFLSDRKSTRLNSSHQIISYAVFCLKKKKQAMMCSDISR